MLGGYNSSTFPFRVIGQMSLFIYFSLISELWMGGIASISAEQLVTSSACSILLWTHANDVLIEMCVCKPTKGLERLKFTRIVSLLSNRRFLLS